MGSRKKKRYHNHAKKKKNLRRHWGGENTIAKQKEGLKIQPKKNDLTRLSRKRRKRVNSCVKEKFRFGQKAEKRRKIFSRKDDCGNVVGHWRKKGIKLSPSTDASAGAWGESR